MADLTDKHLTLQDGKLLGLDDFTSAYKEADPGAFAPAEGTPSLTVGGGQKTQIGSTFDAELRKAFGLT